MYNILLVGVGGQGVLTMFKILGNAAQLQGLNVNGAETHGMSQRGGSVYVHFRVNDKEIHSPLVMEGNADLLISLEPIEALRFAKFVKKDIGTIITSINPIDPPNLSLKKQEYPSIDKILAKLNQFSTNVIAIDFLKILGEEEIRNLNISMLGSMTTLKNFPISTENLLKEIKIKLAKSWNEAKTSFEKGQNYLVIENPI